MRNIINKSLGVLALTTALSATMTIGAALAAEVNVVAILTPEQGSDFGWNQQGVEALQAAGEATGVEVIIAENLGYGDVRPTLRELAEDGADLIIAHASGYNTAAPEIGEETGIPVAITDRPDLLAEGAVADYTASGHNGAYLAGRLAAKMTRTGVVGIVVSGEPPSWNNQSAAFAEGALAESPEVEIRYAVIGPAAYADVAGGNRVTEAIIASGADIIFGQGNGSSFGMLQAVETVPAVDGGPVYFIDVIGDKTSIDQGHLLSSVVWNLAPVYTAMIEDLRADVFGTRNYDIQLADDSLSLLQTEHIPEDIWAEIEELREAIIAGEIVVEPVYDAESVHALVTAIDVPE